VNRFRTVCQGPPARWCVPRIRPKR
jgi:hypothetical protein